VPAKPAPAAAPAAKTEAAEAETATPPPPLTFLNEELIEKENGDVLYFYRTNFTPPAQIIAAINGMGFGTLPGLKPLKEVPGSTNQMVIEGDPDAVALVLDAIAYFDVGKPQVFIEAKVIEVTYDSNFEFGLDYLLDRNVSGPNTLFRSAEAVLNPPSFLRSGFAPNFPFQGSAVGFGTAGQSAIDFGAFTMNYQALQINGKAEVLSKPSIIATQGIVARISTEEQVPIVALNSATRTSENFAAARIRTGVKLEIMASHIGDQYVTLSIKPEVRGAGALAAGRPGGTFAPVETLRSADTTVTLADNETLVIGGLYTNQTTTEKAKTPVLSEMPFLGNLFTRTKETKQKTELIFILTPHIVRKTSDLKIIVPPKELERLEGAEKGNDCGRKCGEPIKIPQPCIPAPPGWGAQLEDD
jgi:type II secretory pathway component GspD/PulD (secretin)